MTNWEVFFRNQDDLTPWSPLPRAIGGTPDISSNILSYSWMLKPLIAMAAIWISSS